jgi:hypothetical protein
MPNGLNQFEGRRDANAIGQEKSISVKDNNWEEKPALNNPQKSAGKIPTLCDLFTVTFHCLLCGVMPCLADTARRRGSRK